MSAYKAFGLLLALSAESVMILVGAVFAGRWLNVHHDVGWDWTILLMPLAIVIISLLFWRVVRVISPKGTGSGAEKGGL